MISDKQKQVLAKAVNRFEISSAVASGVSAVLPPHRRNELYGVRLSIMVDAARGDVLSIDVLCAAQEVPDAVREQAVEEIEVKAVEEDPAPKKVARSRKKKEA